MGRLAAGISLPQQTFPDALRSYRMRSLNISHAWDQDPVPGNISGDGIDAGWANGANAVRRASALRR